MNVSNDFSVRMMGLHTTQIPEDKDDVTDEAVESIFMKLMTFQTFVDISRCKKLSPSVVKYFNAGMSLLYLDISYTRVNRLEPICTNCVNLKAINLAGLELLDRDYKALENLTCAELVNMRSSNVQNIQCLSQLHCLRSLDLGHTNILNINPLTNKTRLEELLLDHCSVAEFQKNKYFLFQALHSLSGLKLFNYCNSDIGQYSIQIRRTIKSDYYLETITRREKFFQAIVDNDAPKMLDCITSGQDIDMRAVPEDIAGFTTIYKARCIAKYSSTPFVLCNHSNPEYRPAGIHLAILFNSYDCFQILMDLNVSKAQSVWFGDVVVTDNILQAAPEDKLMITITGYDSAVLGRNSTNVYNTKDLINMVFQRNMHRVTEKMFEKKISNWKTLCANINKRLLYLYDSTRVAKRMTQEQLNLRNSFAFSAEMEDEEGNLLEGGAEGGEGAGALVNIEDGNSTKVVEATTIDAASTPSTGVASGGGGALLKIMKEVAAAMSVTTALTPVTDLAAMPVKKKRVSMIDSTVVKTPKKLIPERKDSKYKWREHSMVKKLVNLPEVITEKIAVKPATTASMSSTRASASAMRASTGTLRQSWAGGAMSGNNPNAVTYKIKETSVLGAKSYWLESRKHWAFEKAHREAADYCSDDEDTEEGLDTVHHHHKFFKNDPHPNAHKHPHDHKLDHSDAALKDFKRTIIDLHADQARQAKLALEQKLADAKAREIERRKLEEQQRAAFEDYIQNFHVHMDLEASSGGEAAAASGPSLSGAAAAAVVTNAAALQPISSPVDGEDSVSRMSSPDNFSRTKSVDELMLASPSKDDISVGGNEVANVSGVPATMSGGMVKPAPLKKQMSTSDRKTMLVRQLSMRVEERASKALEG